MGEEWTLEEERPPVSPSLKVLDHMTLFKSAKWWSAVVLMEAFGRRQIGLYLWVRRGDSWRRKHKFVIQDEASWEAVKEAVERFLPRLSGP